MFETEGIVEDRIISEILVDAKGLSEPVVCVRLEVTDSVFLVVVICEGI